MLLLCKLSISLALNLWLTEIRLCGGVTGMRSCSRDSFRLFLSSLLASEAVRFRNYRKGCRYHRNRRIGMSTLAIKNSSDHTIGSLWIDVCQSSRSQRYCHLSLAQQRRGRVFFLPPSLCQLILHLRRKEDGRISFHCYRLWR